ncbi:uncharacterized protein LOC110411700 isoform X3 [Herrania umbratica]|uniref:Uncharacterized protein LOC110411700 isoform X3 n=1 Tax=Herrania umbratica TaxID=108875 RepID=A0A6J0ZSS0_9ROSI|nr:uncharacterized protein LOC110411700 isoform X3 [Herrania umbratica]
MATVQSHAHASAYPFLSSSSPRSSAPNFTAKPKRFSGVRCAVSPPKWRESRRLVSISMLFSHLLLVPNCMLGLILVIQFVLSFHSQIIKGKVLLLYSSFFFLPFIVFQSIMILSVLSCFKAKSWPITFNTADAIAGSFLDKYVKRKKLDPLEVYVPAVILTEFQIKDLEKTLEVDKPEYAICRSLLRSGPAASLRINIRAVAQYASDAGSGENAFNDVDQCLRSFYEANQLGRGSRD